MLVYNQFKNTWLLRVMKAFLFMHLDENLSFSNILKDIIKVIALGIFYRTKYFILYFSKLILSFHLLLFFVKQRLMTSFCNWKLKNCDFILFFLFVEYFHISLENIINGIFKCKLDLLLYLKVFMRVYFFRN